jgi:hypothetical protein
MDVYIWFVSFSFVLFVIIIVAAMSVFLSPLTMLDSTTPAAHCSARQRHAAPGMLTAHVILNKCKRDVTVKQQAKTFKW